MKMYVGTEWVDKRTVIPVINPYDGSQVDTVPKADGDDIELYANASRAQVIATFHTLRQQTEKRSGQFNQALGDFIRLLSDQEAILAILDELAGPVDRSDQHGQAARGGL